MEASDIEYFSIMPEGNGGTEVPESIAQLYEVIGEIDVRNHCQIDVLMKNFQ